MSARRPSFPALLAGLFLLLVPGAAHAGMIGAGTSPRSVVLGDLNEDGYLDLISGNADNMVTVHLGRGNRTYDPRVSYVVGAAVAGVAVADLNADDHLDVVVTCPTIDKISVRFGAGDGGLSARTDYTLGGAPRAVAVGDFNGDTVPDLALVGDGFDLVLMVGTGGGAFSPPGFFGVGPTASDLALGDFDGNGALDIATASNASGVTIWRGTGFASFLPPVSYSMGGTTSDVTLADFDSDGDLDVAAPVASINQVVIRPGNGDGTFGPLAGYISTIGPTAVASGDLNGDTRPDLVVSSPTSSAVFVHRNNGGGAFSVHPYQNAGVGINGIAIGNLDVLAPIDLAFSVSGQNSINVVQGNGDITFVAPAGPLYVWANASGQAWNPSAWLPPRNAPSTSDVLVFNRGGSIVVSDVGTSSVRQVVFSGGTAAECAGLGTATLTITGGAGQDLMVERSSKLVLNASSLSTVLCNVASGATAEINGDVEIRTAGNKLQALDVNGIVFQSTGRAIIGPGSSGTPFGDGTGASGLNSVLFHFGSVYIAQTTVAVFGASAPSAVVVFWPGSRFRQDVAFTPAASGRTYADFEYNVPGGNTTITGANPFQVDSLIVTQGTFTMGMTGQVTIRGNLSTPACSTLSQLLFAPASAATYKLGGTSRQSIHGPAGCFNLLRMYASPNVTFDIDNPAGVEFSQAWRTTASFHFTHGNVSSTGNWQVVPDSSATVTNASQSTGWFVCPLVRRVTADGIVRIDVGDSANYLPVDVNAHGVTQPGYVLAATSAQDFTPIEGAQIDLAHRVHRTWLVEGSNTATNFPPSTFLSSLDATFPFLPTDVSSGSDPLQFEVRQWGIGPPAWLPATHGTRTANSIQVTGLSPSVLRDYLYYVAGQPITPALSVVNASESEGNGPGPNVLQTTQTGPADLAMATAVIGAEGEVMSASTFRTPRLDARRAAPARAQSAGSLAFRVRLSQAAVTPISVDYETVDGTATVADGDYTPVSGTLNFAPGDTALDVVVPFGADATPEFNETFGITLSNPSGDVTISAPTATGTILDDDDVTAPAATVLYPNGGELILQNQQVNLTWTATDDFTVTSVDLYIVRGSVQEALAIGHPNTGSYAWTASGAASNKVRFRVVAHDVNHQTIDNSNANWELSASAIGVDDAAPLAFALPAPAPNPAPAGRNRIAFAMPHAANVKLTVHDLQGRTLAKLADGPVPAGRHERTWDATRAAAGVYFIRFEAPGFHAERRLVVVR